MSAGATRPAAHRRSPHCPAGADARAACRRLTRRARAWRRLVAGRGLLSLVCSPRAAAAVAGPLAPYPEDAEGAIHADVRLQPPSWEHPFGTDELGRDVFSRVLIGARISLPVGVIVLVIGVTIGTVLGAIAGFVGGRVGEAIMRFTDIVITIPELILALAITAVARPQPAEHDAGDRPRALADLLPARPGAGGRPRDRAVRRGRRRRRRAARPACCSGRSCPTASRR